LRGRQDIDLCEGTKICRRRPDNGEIVAVAVTSKDIDDVAMADALLDQIADPITSFTAGGAYDQDQVMSVSLKQAGSGVSCSPPFVPRPRATQSLLS
jgi:hypothetical protein